MSIPLLSIIVPVYNVEAYIVECLESILSQTFSNYEVILSDDGSTDNSGKICDEYAAKDPRFKVIHKTNGGVSSARNAALDICSGKYLTMLDPDDSIAADTYENVTYLEHHPETDILQFPYINCYPDGHQEILRPQSMLITGKEQILLHWWEGNLLHFANLNKIFRRHIFDDLRYREGHTSEDTYLMADFAERARQIFISEKGSYFYKIRNNSLTSSYDFEKHMDLFDAHLHNYKALLHHPALQEIRVKAFIRLYRRLITAHLSDPTREIRSQLKEVKQYMPSWKDIRANTSLGPSWWMSLVKITGPAFFMRFFCFYLKIRKRGNS